MLKHLPKKFKEFLGKNTEKHLNFSIELKITRAKINRETKEQADKDIKYYMKLIDSFRSMSNSLSNMTDNISEKVHEKP